MITMFDWSNEVTLSGQNAQNLGLKSHPKDHRSGGSLLQSLDWQSSVLSTTLPPLLRMHRGMSASFAFLFFDTLYGLKTFNDG